MMPPFTLTRTLKIICMIGIGLSVAGWSASKFLLGPSPEDILSSIGTTPSPVLSPIEAQASFRTAPGFHIELVASEPLVVDPVAMDWDDEGRLYVVEMRGFMRNLDADDEGAPSGRVVVLEDFDKDGQMDTSRVFLDNLVLPRGIAVLPQGVLIGSPPDLILCRDHNDNLSCEDNEKTRLTSYADGPVNVEHAENGLLPGIDGWIYNAKSNRRFQLTSDTPSPQIIVDKAVSRGQWGIAQDDEGRLYYNHNSTFLFTDVFPGEYTLRQPATRAREDKHGIGVKLTENEQVWGIRTAAGLNRAYVDDVLRADGRQNAPTAISSLAVQRGDQYGPDHVGDVFVPESAGSVVAHFSVDFDGNTAQAHHRLYDDYEWVKREFLASTDERFRPVDVEVGPDGALWVVDMYRGIVQHKAYMSDHLRAHIQRLGLESPGETGRIWRIVKTDHPINHRVPPLQSLPEQLTALNHPNGWVRDRAQRRLSHEKSANAIEALRTLEGFSTKGRLHALWTLQALDALDLPTWQYAMRDPNPGVRRHALQLTKSLLPEALLTVKAATLQSLDDNDDSVRLQALHTLGDLPVNERPIAMMVKRASEANELEQQAILSSLASAELEALKKTLATGDKASPGWVQKLTTAALLAAQDAADYPSSVSTLLDIAYLLGDSKLGRAMVMGMVDRQHMTGNVRVVLSEPHRLFQQSSDNEYGNAVTMARAGFTWDGDAPPRGVRALSASENESKEQGKQLFAATCATCHGENGRGITGLAPPLAGSSWARDADEWLIRIALHGIHGPISVLGDEWDKTMPGFANDPRFDDATLAGLATHIRRSWGNADPPVSQTSVARIRQQTQHRSTAWTADELIDIPVKHRLDPYIGTYQLPIIGVKIQIRRMGNQLTMGLSTGGEGPLTELSYGVFNRSDVTIAFDFDEDRPTGTAKVTYRGQTFDVSRTEIN